MNAARCSPTDYIAYQIASPSRYTCTEAARCQPEVEQAPAHDDFTRLLQRQPADTADLWQEAQQLIPSRGGILVVDDTTLDKPYARKIELVTWHWSGKHHRVVQGINLVSLLWTEGTARIPCDFRVYDKPVGGKTKNEHLRDMVTAAHTRGLQPEYVLCDSWYSSLDNLKHLRQLGWAWLTRLKSNRQVNPDRSGNVAIRDLKIPGLTKGSVYTPAVPNGIPHAEDTNQMPPWRLCTQEIIHSVGGFSMLRFCNCVEPGTVP